MTPEQETEIIEKFTEALTGLFGPLKPAQAIVRCVDFIAYLREEYLPWSDIERLFNQALKGLGRRGLSKGSISRLYYMAAGSAAAGSRQRADASPRADRASSAADASATPSTYRASPDGRAEPGGAIAEPDIKPIEPDASVSVRVDDGKDAPVGSHLDRLAQRKADKLRMEQS